MLKFEEIVANEYIKENVLTYNMLSNTLHSNGKKIVCYIGAGLSLYCKRWNELFKHIYDGIPQNVKEENGLKKNWEEYCADKVKFDYLEIADEVDNILKKSTPQSSFNKEVQLYITEQINAKKQLYPNTEIIEYISIGTSKEKAGIPSDIVYYLPYFLPGIPKLDIKKQPYKGRILTTNVDDSILDAFAYYNLEIMQLQAIHQMSAVEMNQNQHIVFYIHGYYSHIESFVMTGKDYKKTYSNNKNKRLLKEYAYDSEAVWIFLGAGLENDPPLKTLESCFGSINDKENQLRNFAFLSERKENITTKRKNVEEKYFANTFFIPQDAFYCYSIVFCQLIRETKGAYWNTFVCEKNEPHSLYTTKPCIDDKDIKDILENQKIFDCMKHSIDESLKQKLKKYLYNGFNRIFVWSVCWIDSENFDFSSEKFNPLKYQWPLGNTIYLIHNISPSKKDNCITTLKNWCDGSKHIFDNEIKVRVFYQPEREYFINSFAEFRKNHNVDSTLLVLLNDLLDKLNISETLNAQLINDYENILLLLKGNTRPYVKFLYDFILKAINEQEQLNKLYQIYQTKQEESVKEEYTQNSNQQESTNINNEQVDKNNSILSLKKE